jgi:hypothetical protein
MPGSPSDDADWERVWRQADDEFLIESAKIAPARFQPFQSDLPGGAPPRQAGAIAACGSAPGAHPHGLRGGSALLAALT